MIIESYVVSVDEIYIDRYNSHPFYCNLATFPYWVVVAGITIYSSASRETDKSVTQYTDMLFLKMKLKLSLLIYFLLYRLHKPTDCLYVITACQQKV